jgi:hypothetical protein
MEASAEAAKNEPALSYPLVPQWVKVRLGERVFFSGLYTLTDEHFRTYYRHENAKNPRPVVDFRGPSSLTVRDFTTGEPIETGELISEGKRVYLLQKARRKQREAIAEIAALGVGWMYSVARYMEEVIPGSPTVRTPLGVTNGERTSENSGKAKFVNKGKRRRRVGA